MTQSLAQSAQRGCVIHPSEGVWKGRWRGYPQLGCVPTPPQARGRVVGGVNPQRGCVPTPPPSPSLDAAGLVEGSTAGSPLRPHRRWTLPGWWKGPRRDRPSALTDRRSGEWKGCCPTGHPSALAVAGRGRVGGRVRHQWMGCPPADLGIEPSTLEKSTCAKLSI